ncbi:MAG: Uncharacterised protein [Flavobacterium sp. SCGC AAA160-P02]|nr:MAG: Uncharacterised protein [Flavobacterium sp. SCGC AAA160-P02]
MVNIDGFSNRIKEILDYNKLTASVFADKIGVQRSSISHILSGRNKPSLDFIMKVINSFEDVDIYWLLNGSGSFPKKSKAPSPISQSNISLISEENPPHSAKKINRIVVFYNDGTFDDYIKQ